MKSTNFERPTALLTILSFCLVFVGLGGFTGGYFMLTDPNGSPMGMSVSQLAKTPFQNYFIPGLLLIFVWGFGSLLVLISLWKHPNLSIFNWLSYFTNEHWTWVLPILFGLALLIWLTVQLFTLPSVIPMQFFLFGLALVLITVPQFPSMRFYYKQFEREQ